MAKEYNSTQTSSIRGGYVPFTLNRDYHLDLFKDYVDTTNQQHERALEQQAKISEAIANIQLDEHENEWKTNYINNISKQIDNAARFGNYSSALSTATRLAGKAASDPALLGRQRYYTERQKWLEELKTRNARKEIDSDTYQRALAQNEYAYEDTKDAAGNITGGISWSASFDPVDDVDIGTMMGALASLVRPNATASSHSGGTSQTFYTAEGGTTTDPSKAAGIYSTSSGGSSSSSYEGITAERWEKAFDAWRTAHPEYIQAIEQKRQNQLWLYKSNLDKLSDITLSDEDRAKAKAISDQALNQLTDESGAIIAPEKYAKHLANKFFGVMAYSHTSSSSGGGGTTFNEQFFKDRNLGREIQNTLNSFGGIYGTSSPLVNVLSMTNGLDVSASNFVLSNSGQVISFVPPKNNNNE